MNVVGTAPLIEGIGSKPRQTTTVELARYRHDSSAGFPDGNLYAFIEEMRSLLDRVPAEHRSKVEIDFSAYSDREGYPEPVVCVYYSRPETEEEEKKRLAEEELRALDEARRLRNQAKGLLVRANALGISSEKLGFVISDETAEMTIGA